MKTIMFIFVITCLFLSRPNKCVHKEKIQSFVSESLNIKDGIVFGVGTEILIDRKIEYNDYLLFTTTTINEKIITFGVLRYVHINTFTLKLFAL